MTASELIEELKGVVGYCDDEGEELEVMIKVDSYLYSVGELNADEYELVAYWGDDRPVIVIDLDSQEGGCSRR